MIRQVRGPLITCAHSRRLPGPESFRLVTSITAPPRPPWLHRPKPSAPSKASGAPFGQEPPVVVGGGVVGGGGGVAVEVLAGMSCGDIVGEVAPDETVTGLLFAAME